MVDDRHPARCLSSESLIEFVRGTASPAQRERAEDHFAECDACRALLAELARSSLVAHSDATGPTALLEAAPASATPEHRSEQSAETLLADGQATRPRDSHDAGSPSSHLPTRIGRYHLLDLISAGGMGIVYAAYDPDLDRKIALKLLHPSHDRGQDDSARQLRARIVREAQAMARVSHPNVVPVHDVGVIGDEVFIAMEFVDGKTLGHWSRTTPPRGWREIVDRFVAAGRGLAAAHEVGLVHRDFKPDNVLIGNDGRVRVADFGLARFFEQDSPEERVESSIPPRAGATGSPQVSALRRDDSATRTGAVLGTPAYMAPEQRVRSAVDARSDQFSFCLALHEALFGERLLIGDVGGLPVPRATACQPATGISSAPLRLKRAISRGLSEQPDQRFPTMDALLVELMHDPTVVRKRWAIAAVAAGCVAVAATVTFVATRQEPGPAPCSTARARLAGAWDAAVATSVRRSFTNAAGDRSGASLERVVATLDRYAERWVAGHTDACEATAVRKEQSPQLLDLRMQCLDRRRTELAALTALFATADAELVAKAPQAAYALVPPETCADREALAARHPPPRPEVSERVGAIQRRLAEASARHIAGKWRAGLALAEPLVAEAKQLDYPPLVAETLFLTAVLHRDLREGPAATAGLRELTVAAARARDDLLLARTWTELLVVVGSVESKPDEAFALETPARSMLARVGNDARVEARLHTGLGLALEAKSKWSDARRQLEQAMAIQTKVLGPEDPELAMTLHHLAGLRMREGAFADALAVADRSLAIREKVLGPDHPVVARSLNTRGSILWMLKRRDEAFEMLERAVTIEERANSPEYLSLINLAKFRVDNGEHAKAIPLFERALPFLDTAGADAKDALAAAHAHNGLGSALGKTQRCGEAIPHLQRSIELLEKTGSSPPLVASSLQAWATCDQSEGRMALARERLDRAVATGEALGPESTTLVFQLSERGHLALTDRRPRDALRDFERALPIANKLATVKASTRSSIERGLGEALLDLRRTAEAIPHVERSLELVATDGSPREIAKSELLLARVLWDGAPASRRRARKLAEQARASFAKLGEDDKASQAAVWLAAHR